MIKPCEREQRLNGGNKWKKHIKDFYCTMEFWYDTYSYSNIRG